MSTNPVRYTGKFFVQKLSFATVSAAFLLFCLTADPTLTQAEPRISQNIDDTRRVTLKGNTRPEVKTENDRGAVPDDFPMQHMLLQLRRSPHQESLLNQFIDELHAPGSPIFHQWITAQEFGERFGLAKQDLDALAGWLEAHGFTVNVVYPSGVLIDFSGTAGQVRQAFHTEIHHIEVNGENHIANISDPQIPTALASVVSGVVSLHDFRPHTMYKLRNPQTDYTFPGGALFATNYALVPADLATIYSLNPLFRVGYSGQDQTIVVIEDTDVFSTSDWNTFRSKLGLSNYTTGSFKTVHPRPSHGSNNCSDPGVVAPNDAEAILDAEWASAAAPGAAIELASCADTRTTFGGLIAIQNLINGSTLPPRIMSISYGQCETVNGATANAAYNSSYQQAVTEGVSVFVAAGDSGAAGCDNGAAEASSGVAVNAFASTPYNVAVGGTDFSDTYSNTNSTYWNSTNSPSYGSALSYIPEIPWNNSCASALIASYWGGNPTTYGSGGFCNSFLGSLEFVTTAAGGGGPSACATGAPSNGIIVSGTCAGWPKPEWQSILNNPSDGVRDTPDLSLFAADGVWAHYYVFCWSDILHGGAACTGAPSGWSGAGGTSFAAPIMAGIQALVNQNAGTAQGNPNPVYYQLAAAEYGSTGNSTCNSGNGNAAGNSCVFYDITQGDMDVPCVGTANCFLDSSTNGVLSTDDASYRPAYGTHIGWDFATGIGSVNATNLVNNWPNSTPNFSLSTSASAVTVMPGTSSRPITITVNPQNGFTGTVSLSVSGLPTGVTAQFSPTSTSTTSVLTLTASATATTGTFNTIVTGTSGNLIHTAQITLQCLFSSTTTLSSSLNPATYGQSVTLTAIISPSTATGAVQFLDGSTSLGTVALSSGKSSLSISSLSAGVHSITANYSGDSKYLGSVSAALSETVNKASSSTVVSSSANPSTVGQNITFTATISSSAATGTVTFYDSTTNLGTVALSAGKAILTTSNLSTGSHSISAAYGGDSNFIGSSSTAITQIVIQGSTSTSLVSAPNPSLSGTAVSFTATVTASSGLGPTGSITFQDGATTLSAVTLNSNGQATLTIASLSVGFHAITGVYSGDANFAGSVSQVLTQTVNPLNPTGPANGYSYERLITIDHTKVANTDQINFPVLISGTYSYLASTANGGNIQRLDGNGNALDLVFTSDSGCSNLLSFELETYVSTTGQIAYWVQVPGVSHSSDTVFYLCYGNSSVNASQANVNGTWDSSFKAVVHFANATSLSGADSTSAGNNLSNSGASAGVGLIGGAAVTVANSGYLARSNPTGFPSGTSPRTLETWFKKTDGNTAGEEIVSYGNNTVNGDRFAVYFGSGALYAELQGDGRGFAWSNDGNWHHIALVLPSGGSKTSDILIYLDGVAQLASGGSLTLTTSTADFAVGTIAGAHGNAGFNGVVDEVRVSNAARSADWIATEYNNQSAPATFFSIGPVQTSP